MRKSTWKLLFGPIKSIGIINGIKLWFRIQRGLVCSAQGKYYQNKHYEMLRLIQISEAWMSWAKTNYSTLNQGGFRECLDELRQYLSSQDTGGER